MHIRLDPRTGEQTLLHAEDFTSFAVVVPSAADLPLSEATVPASLGQVTSDGDHVFVHPDAVRALAGVAADDPSWQTGFEAMLAYAGRRGWLASDGSAIRAHCSVEAALATSTERT